MTALITALRNDIRELTTLSPQVKFILLIQVVILFSLSILVGIFFSPKFKQSIILQDSNLKTSNKQPSMLRLKSTRLSISPVDHLMRVGSESTFSVLVEGEDPQAVDIVIHYDPTFISISDITSTGLLDFERINEIKGNAVYFSAASSLEQLDNPKEGALFTFKVKALRKTPETPLTFDKKYTITAIDGKNTVLHPSESTEIWGGIIRILD